MKFEPLPCPCCGSKAEFFMNSIFTDSIAMYIECTVCGVGTAEVAVEDGDMMSKISVMEDLRSTWNKRAQLAPIATYEPRRIQQRKLQ